MKIILSLFLLSSLLVACQSKTEPTSSEPQSTSNTQPEVQESSGASENPVPGGETAQAIDSPEAKAMRSNAENLLNQKYSGANISLGDIKAFSTQVVAGTNFRLEVSYSDQKGGAGTLKLTIYRDLDNNYSLTEDDYPTA